MNLLDYYSLDESLTPKESELSPSIGFKIPISDDMLILRRNGTASAIPTAPKEKKTQLLSVIAQKIFSSLAYRYYYPLSHIPHQPKAR